MHPGLDTSENRCLLCGDKEHNIKDCKAPGGGADPNKETVWAEYRKRKEEAHAKGKCANPKASSQPEQPQPGVDKGQCGG
ncbi:hypothetical protein N9L68_02390 [bacterium]|nr:hypothetical protein [bacterium]